MIIKLQYYTYFYFKIERPIVCTCNGHTSPGAMFGAGFGSCLAVILCIAVGYLFLRRMLIKKDTGIFNNSHGKIWVEQQWHTYICMYN